MEILLDELVRINGTIPYTVGSGHLILEFADLVDPSLCFQSEYLAAESKKSLKDVTQK